MNLLGATLYDPAAAVSKATSSLLAMTAFDTTNLRLTATVPAHGMLRIRLVCTIVGATTVPTVLLGVMNGATVVGRQTPLDFPGTMNAATQSCPCIADFIVTGLTPGSITLDAAYAVQVVVASTNIKYGGPNTNGGANAWGAFSFEIYDPRPMTLALDGAVNVKQWNGTNVATPATAGVPDVNVKNINNVSASPVTTVKAVQGLTTADTIATYTGNTPQTGDVYPLVDTEVAAIKAKTDQLAFTVANQVDVNVIDWKGSAAPAMTGDAFARLGVAGAGLTALGDTRIANLDTTISSRTKPADTQAAVTTVTTTTNLTNLPSIPANWLTAAGIAASALNGKGDWNIGKTGYALSAAGVQAIWDALTSALTTVGSIGKLLVTNIDALISSRSTYAGGDTSGVTTLLSRLTSGRATGLDNLDATVSSRLATSGYAAPDNADILLIKAKTDNLPASPAASSDCITAAGVRSAVGLASANLDTQLDALPTNAELATALGTADDATLAAIAALNNISTAQAQTAAAAALTAYDPPTRAEATADKDAVITEINANETKIDGIKTKTDSLSFTVTGKVDANITHVNETAVGGTGAADDEWGPV